MTPTTLFWFLHVTSATAVSISRWLGWPVVPNPPLSIGSKTVL
jgi:hypothetical protein